MQPHKILLIFVLYRMAAARMREATESSGARHGTRATWPNTSHHTCPGNSFKFSRNYCMKIHSCSKFDVLEFRCRL